MTKQSNCTEIITSKRVYAKDKRNLDSVQKFKLNLLIIIPTKSFKWQGLFSFRCAFISYI